MMTFHEPGSSSRSNPTPESAIARRPFTTGALLLLSGLTLVGCGGSNAVDSAFSGQDLRDRDPSRASDRDGGRRDERQGEGCHEAPPQNDPSEPPRDLDPCTARRNMCLPGRVFESSGTCPSGETPIRELECAPLSDGTPMFCCPGPEGPSAPPYGEPPEEPTRPEEPSRPEEPPPPPEQPEEPTRPEEPPPPPEQPGEPSRPEEPTPGGDACPEVSSASVRYVSFDPLVCASISYVCPSNSVPFDGACGCGCVWFADFPAGG